jgi:ferric-dicitrate binding protein FerR (iron transport regulator)
MVAWRADPIERGDATRSCGVTHDFAVVASWRSWSAPMGHSKDISPPPQTARSAFGQDRFAGRCLDSASAGLLARRQFLAALAAVLGMPSGATAASEPTGRVDEVHGSASAELAGARRNLAPEADVFLGDNLATGDSSRLKLHLGRETRLWLGERARVKIDRFLVDAGGDIVLRSGPLLIDKPPGAQPLNIRNTFGLISVRGTRLFAGPSNGVFGVLVVHGEVTVTAARQRVTLRGGEGTDIRAPGAPPTPPRMWGQPRVDAALASVF